MDIVSSNFLPGDPRLIDQIVYELKSQGIFDQFRKECIADVDTKPAYQNLSQRVEGSVMNFLNQQKFAEDLNKNQLREQLRKNISESGFLDSGVERIVDQVVNPKINTVFLPKVEDVVYRFLGIKRPNQEGQRQEVKPNVEDLLPNDLEAVSPESVHDQSVANLSVEKKEENVEEANDNSLNSSNTKTEDESPPFEPLEENTKFSPHEEENSVDSHLSGFSGLASRDSTQSTEMQVSIQMDISQDVSQTSVNSEGNLSIITSEDDVKMEICDDTIIPETADKAETITDAKEENNQVEIKTESNTISNFDFKDAVAEKTEVSNDLKETSVEVDINSKKTDEKKRNSTKSDSKRSHDKHKSSRNDKDKKDDKDKRSRSKSESKSKDKLSSRHSSSSKDKDKKEYTNGKDSLSSKKDDKDKDRSRDKSSSKSKDKEKSDKKSEKTKEKSDKDQERSDKDKASKDKERSSKEKARDKDKSDKTKSHKDRHERDRSSSSKQSKEKSSSSSKKDSKEKDTNEDKTLKDKSSSSSKDKTSSSSKSSSSKSSKDKDKSSSSSSKDRDKKGGGDSKSKLKKSDKDKSSSHDKSSSSSKKDKEKKVADDHYSLKDKKNDRRSTDRDSNDGSSKTSRNSSFAENHSGSFKGSSKESSEVFSSGGGESSNSDSVDKAVEDKNEVEVVELANVEVTSPIKYIKPKFASNIHEAMRIMKIRKQLAKLERQNQLALTNVPVVAESVVDVKVQQNLTGSKEKVKPAKKIKFFLEEEQAKAQKEAGPKTNHKPISSPKNNGKTINTIDTFDDTPILKSQDLSMESFEQLEARLAQEMSNINDHMYGDEDDNYEYSSIIISPIKTQKPLEQPKIVENKILFKALTLPSLTKKEISSDSEDDIQLVMDEDDVITEEKLAANVAQEKSIQKDAGHLTNTAAQIDLDEFKGFTILDTKNTTSKLIEQEIKKINQYIHKKEKEFRLNKILKKQPKILQKQNKFYNPMKFEIKDLLQKNGKKLFIKIDKLNIELTSKVLVTLQDMDVGGVVQDTTNINGLKQTTKTAICIPNGQANKQLSNSPNRYITEKPKSEESFVIKWEDEDAPCYYFNKADSISNIHMGILNEHIAKLKKSIEEQSLNIQNNIPKPMKRNFKRKLQGSENNNSITYNDYKPERKRRHLTDANSNRHGDNLCNTNVSAADQSFNLPLSPAESDKSGEHKKEEPLMVKPKRTGRTLTNKRYSTEDLYKPRPILCGSSTRRRSGRVDDSRP